MAQRKNPQSAPFGVIPEDAGSTPVKVRNPADVSLLFGSTVARLASVHLRLFGIYRFRFGTQKYAVILGEPGTDQ